MGGDTDERGYTSELVAIEKLFLILAPGCQSHKAMHVKVKTLLDKKISPEHNRSQRQWCLYSRFEDYR